MLTLRPEGLVHRRVVAAEQADHLLGFYTLDGTPPDAELGNLWIDPAYLGQGIGRFLWHHAATTAHSLGSTSMALDADPHAEGST